MNLNPGERLFIMTLLGIFNVIHVNFMIMLKKRKRKKKFITFMLSMTGKERGQIPQES